MYMVCGCTVQFRIVRQSRVTRVPDVPKYGFCHASQGPLMKGQYVTHILIRQFHWNFLLPVREIAYLAPVVFRRDISLPKSS